MDDYVILFLAAVAALYIPLLAWGWWMKRRDECPHKSPDNFGRHC